MLLFIIISCGINEPDSIKGCTDNLACNYSVDANFDDGSCAFEYDCIGNCGGSSYRDQCGFCDADPGNDCQDSCEAIWAALVPENGNELNAIGDYYEHGLTQEIYYGHDIDAIQHIINNNPHSLHIGMDTNNDNKVSVLEYGIQEWLNTRLISLDLDYDENVIMPTTCNSRINILPEYIGKLSDLHELSFNGNELMFLPDSICELGNLQELLIEDNLLITLPENFGNLTSLQRLYLNNNDIRLLPDSFSNLDSLEILWLHNNNLELLPDSIGNLSSLTQFWLHNNNITSIPQSIGSLYEELDWLRLDYNELFSLPNSICQLGDNPDSLTIKFTISNNLTCPVYPPCVDKMIGYQQCDNCSRSYLIGDGSAGINGASSECLNIYDWDALQDIIDANDVYTGLKPINIVPWVNWSRTNMDNRLMKLDLNWENLKGKIPDSIGDMDSMRVLYLYGNYLTGSIPESIGQLKNLKELKLNTNKLGCYDYDIDNDICNVHCDSTDVCYGDIPNSMSEMTNLELLDLKDNYLSGLPDNISALTNLTHLKLRYNQITGPIPDDLFTLEKLKWLDLSRNRFTGFINNGICNQVENNLDRIYFTDNRLCPDYPDCLNISQIGVQDTDGCSD